MSAKIKKIVLAYSGGLDTSIILKWLQEAYQAEVVAYIADVGQGEELEEARVKALKTGAVEAIVGDLKEEFVRDFVFGAMRANAMYEGNYLLGTSVARPIIAKGMIEALRATGADRRLPRRDRQRQRPGALRTDRPGDGARRAHHRALARRALDVELPREDDRLRAGARHSRARDEGQALLVRPQPAAHLLRGRHPRRSVERAARGHVRAERVARKGARHADLRRNRVRQGHAGRRQRRKTWTRRTADQAQCARRRQRRRTSGHGREPLRGHEVARRVRDPRGTILYAAHRAVESLTMDREVMLQRDLLSPKIAQLIYNGFWYSPEMEALTAFIDKSQENVTGTARVKLYKGNCTVVGRKAEKTLYDTMITTFEEDEGAYDQADATGFIRLNALRLRVRNKAGFFKG